MGGGYPLMWNWMAELLDTMVMPTVGKQKQDLGLWTILRRTPEIMFIFPTDGTKPKSCCCFRDLVWQFHSLTSIFPLTNVYVRVCDTALEDRAVTETGRTLTTWSLYSSDVGGEMVNTYIHK